MRIVDVNELYSPTGGGVRTYIDRKIPIMAALGHEQIVIAPGQEDRVDERQGGRIIYIKAPRLVFDRNYGMFWDPAPIHRLLDELKPDVVENSAPWRSAAIVADWPGPALKAWFLHNDNLEVYPKRWLAPVASPQRIERWFDWYNRYLARRFARYDTIVSNGPVLTKRYRARGLRIDVTMPLGIQPGSFSPDLRDAKVRAGMLEQCGLPEDAHVIMALGRHHPEKEWPTVINAVQRAGSKIPVGLVILGQGPDTRALERHVRQSPHIRLFRPVYDRRQLATLMASADAFIHGAATETFGLVAAEALASGLPMIVPDIGGAFELSRPEFAEVYRAGDAYDAAKAIVRLLRRDQVVLHGAARVAAAQVRSDRDHAADLAAHYRACIEAKRASA